MFTMIYRLTLFSPFHVFTHIIHLFTALFLPGDLGAVKYRYCVFSGGKFDRWEGDGKMNRVLVSEGHENMSRSDKDLAKTADCFGVLHLEDGQPSEPISSVYDATMNNAAVISISENISFKAKQFAEWGRKSKIDTNLKSTDGVIIVAYFLPVILHRTRLGKWSATWDSENILSLDLNARVTFVGSVRYHGAPIPVEDEEEVTIALLSINCHPIFIDQTTHHQFYDLYCKNSLWLTLHHVADVYGPLKQNDIGAQGQQDLWFTYSTVNRTFRDKVVEVFQDGDMVWIQGFHLMLLPSFLRRFLLQAKIGYFFHTPFPSSEIWR